jgi:3-phosphoshikimate 1-carboxyvinyltransferase
VQLKTAHAPERAVSLSARQSGPLTGRVRPPGDKSISHRAFILGLLSVGETRIEGVLEGDDVLRTGEACRALGASVERVGEGSWRVRGRGIGALRTPSETLDFGNAGTGTRLMMGVAGGNGILVRFDGDASLRKRPRAAVARFFCKARTSRRRSNTARPSRRHRSSRRSCWRR